MKTYLDQSLVAILYLCQMFLGFCHKSVRFVGTAQQENIMGHLLVMVVKVFLEDPSEKTIYTPAGKYILVVGCVRLGLPNIQFSFP